MEELEDRRLYHVVVNDEEQYSIWADGSEIPAGWHTAGFTGDRAACLAHIEQVWTDLRPRSLREWAASNA
ncbi:MbtH family protein [Polymorphospora rubra]|uniref:MbtH family protein n=1 Tax=Polymorphospora rubra TaxID=338584 RepID=UPI00340ACF06